MQFDAIDYKYSYILHLQLKTLSKMVQILFLDLSNLNGFKNFKLFAVCRNCYNCNCNCIICYSNVPLLCHALSLMHVYDSLCSDPRN